jgi:hypothetical protein
MEMNQAAVFLGASILLMLGFIVIVVGVILVNNLIHKFWKPVKFWTPDSWQGNPPIRYASSDEIKKMAEKITAKEKKDPDQ